MNSSPDDLSTDDLAELAPAPGAHLTAVQDWMALLLRHRKGLHKSEALSRAAAQHFSGNERLSPAEQVDIYRKQFWLRHTSILIDDFPGVTGLLGQTAWEDVAESYLTERGFDVFALRNLGKRLPEHLAQMPNLKGREILVDMARLEWAYAEAFDRADDTALSPEKLAAIPAHAWAGARFLLSHSLQLLRVSYPVADLRRKLREDPSSCPPRETIAEESQNLVIYRRDGTLWDKQVSTPAYLLLAQFAAGTPLIRACEAVVAADPDAALVFDEQLMHWFALWGRLGWITDVVVEDPVG